MNLKSFVFQAVWILLILPSFSAENLCKSELLISINISAELQSDVLLPCNFNPNLLGSNKTADIAVVWSQRNTTIHNLVEITLQGVAKFWNYKGGRIKTFPKLSESGNFSILLQKVQPYDLSLYHCELFNGSNCRIAYQELQLQLSHENYQSSLLLWSITGALAGGIVLLAVFTTYLLHAKRRQNIIVIETDYENVVGATADSDKGSRQNIIVIETDYENVVGAKEHSDKGSKSIENPIYETVSQNQTSCQPESNCAREEEGLSSGTPVYATVKKGKIVNST
ncbi:uncharacterized protein LOC113531562 isoform X2 [Pangasianodon hypophthalmus]|uniref:uncharacterized protein LOC113531562 isoform X2 n=1 Tax=Pangasianodon hypophthalmus TaxID=310915 RepID=UPI0023081B6B|nr:uncharacterized protein LOC113531562 isoform X2 [Pangasianodon hypophthalmus]